MPGLRDSASGALDPPNQAVQQAHLAWQESMLRQIDELKARLRLQDPQVLADRCGAIFSNDVLGFHYWRMPIRVRWSDLFITAAPDGTPVSTFDAAVLFYYLVTADGSPFEDRWVSYRELPGGTFYHQAFQSYSGDRLAKAFNECPDWLHTAAAALDGWRLTGIGEYAYAFQPLPRVRLALVFWPGDEEFPSRASILFDPADIHYLPIDGLALMGSGLAGRLLKAASSNAA